MSALLEVSNLEVAYGPQSRGKVPSMVAVVGYIPTPEGRAAIEAAVEEAVSYTHLTLPTNREV